MNMNPTGLSAAFLRSALDTLAVCGTGLLATGHQFDVKRLLRLSLMIGLAIAPLRFLPLSAGMQVFAGILVMGSILGMTFHLLSSVGAVMLGGGALSLVEWLYASVLIGAGLAPAELPADRALLLTIPAPVVLICFTMAARALGWRGLMPGIPEEKGFSGSDSVPLAQVFLSLLTLMALTLCPDVGPAEYLLRFGLLAMPVLIFACASKKWRGLQTDILDLVTILPMILFVVSCTGGSSSVYKFLYVPLVMVNALKSSAVYGAISFTSSVLSLVFMGARSLLAGQAWDHQVDLLLAVALAVLYQCVRHFIGIESRLRGELAHIASTDDLTGLYNYRYLQEHLDRAISSGLKTYLILVDLDNFKSLNDRMGHPAGDAFLKAMSARLKKTVRENDVVVRYGGDEFMVLPEQNIEEEQALALADRIRRSIEETYEEFVAGLGASVPDGYGLTASVGVACTTALIRDKDSLLREADEALYTAKSGGKNRAVVSNGAG